MMLYGTTHECSWDTALVDGHVVLAAHSDGLNIGNLKSFRHGYDGHLDCLLEFDICSLCEQAVGGASDMMQYFNQ